MPRIDSPAAHPPCLSCEDQNLIFVFGSNAQGNHAAGAARHAVERHGAVMGAGHGYQGALVPQLGHSYAIDTMSGWDVLVREVEAFIVFARDIAPGSRFFVTAIGCGIAGYTATQIAPLFAAAPLNCILPEGWRTK